MASSKKPMTQRQWLNIMTVTTAFMILLFVIVGRIMEQKLAPAEPLDRPFKNIQSLTIADWQVSLSDDGWQQLPEWLTESELTTMMHRWQNFQPTAWSNQSDFPEVLTMTLINSNKTERWRLLLGDMPLLKSELQDNAIVLSNSEFNRLFPPALLHHWKNTQRN